MRAEEMRREERNMRRMQRRAKIDKRGHKMLKPEDGAETKEKR